MTSAEDVAELAGASWDDREELLLAFADHTDGGPLRESFEGYLDGRAGVHPEVAYYREHGSWRDSASEPPGGELEGALALAPNREPNNCYYNCQTAMTPSAEYGEGYALSPKGWVVPHAWLEVSGTVVDITPTVDRAETEYFGVAFDHGDVAAAMLETGLADPVVEHMVD